MGDPLLVGGEEAALHMLPCAACVARVVTGRVKDANLLLKQSLVAVLVEIAELVLMLVQKHREPRTAT